MKKEIKKKKKKQEVQKYHDCFVSGKGKNLSGSENRRRKRVTCWFFFF